MLTEHTLEGEQVTAAWQDRQGQVRHAAGTVAAPVRANWRLRVGPWRAAGNRRQPDANVDVKRR